MTINHGKEYKTKMLLRIAHSPRTLLDFTDGEVHSTISARHIQRYLSELVMDDLIVYHDGLYSITKNGLLANRPPNLTPPKTWGPMSTSGSYVPPKWNTRDGSEQFLGCPSVGIPT